MLIGGIALRVMAFRTGWMPTFLLYGLPGLTLGLVAVVAAVRNETDVPFRTLLLNIIGGVGAALIAFSAVQGYRDLNFLSTEGVALLILGLFTRPAAFILSGEMAVAYFMVHAPRSFYPLVNGGTLAIIYCFACLYLSSAGAGPWSLDAQMKRN